MNINTDIDLESIVDSDLRFSSSSTIDQDDSVRSPTIVLGNGSDNYPLSPCSGGSR